MTMATNAFAQGVFTVSSSIEPRGRMNGQTEMAGGITLSLTSGGVDGTESGTVMVDFGTTITNALGEGQIVVDICGEAGASTGADANTAIDGSTITLTVDEANTCTGAESIDVSGVRLAIAGQGLSDVSANITSSGDIRLASGANDVAVINSIVDELVDDGVSADKITLIRHTAAPQARSAMDDGTYFKLLIEENAVDSFNDAELNLDFSGIGTGITVTIDAWVSTAEDLDDLEATAYILDDCGQGTNDPMTMVDETRACVTSNQQLALSGGDDPDVLVQTLSSRSSEAVVRMGLGSYLNRLDGDANTDGIQDDTDTDADETTVMGGGLSDTEIDVIVIRGTVRVDTSPRSPTRVPLPLGDVNITATVDVGPIGPAVYSRFHRGDRPIPRFASDESMAVTVIDVTSDQTMLRVPFAAVIPESWDTGIAIANANTDTDQAGTIMFELFSGGDSVEYTTMGGSPGSGLNDDGMLMAGNTYAVQLSSLLDAAGADATFSGYIEITTDFTNAKGFVFLSSFVGGAWGAAGGIEDITDE